VSPLGEGNGGGDDDDDLLLLPEPHVDYRHADAAAACEKGEKS